MYNSILCYGSERKKFPDDNVAGHSVTGARTDSDVWAEPVSTLFTTVAEYPDTILYRYNIYRFNIRYNIGYSDILIAGKLGIMLFYFHFSCLISPLLYFITLHLIHALDIEMCVKV